MDLDLFFTPSQIKTRGRGLAFDDVLLVPTHSEISSRRNPSIATQVTKNYTLDIPVITANMDTITEYQMSCAMAKLGGLGILHRFMPVEEQVNQVRKIQQFRDEHQLKSPVAASIGVKEEGMKRAEALVEAGVQILTIDIAHGDSVMMFETLDYVKKNFSKVDVIVGNVATPEGVKRMIDHGADAVKVGIGPGSMCTTRVITGCGLPQLTAIALCVEEAQKSGVPIIADGGLKTSGDVVKAICAGAASVMVGSMVSATIETPGELKGGQKKYRGMASKDAQVSWRGELPQGMAPEGVSTWVACKGSVENVINELTGGVRSGMSYLNALTLPQMREHARFIELTSAGLFESHPHGAR